MNGDDRSQLELLRIDLSGRLALIDLKLNSIIETQHDHEARLRSVERWKLSIPISVLLAIGTIVGTIIATGGTP